MTGFSPCAVIPTFNHHAALAGILSGVAARELPAIVIDDGSSPEIANRIADICQAHEGVECLRHEFNAGKGFAVLRGLARAAERGFTHAVQIDADGQHDLTALGVLVNTARRDPAAIVVGQPHYDETIPKSRRFGRWLTDFWLGVNTWSTRMPDAMCGFRVYPIEPILMLGRREISARRMEFDPEVIVRAYWMGIRIVSVPVGVTYPDGNTSNFDMVRDNIMISAMHARLFFGMLIRIPRLLKRRLDRRENVSASMGRSQEETPAHWASLAERGASWGLGILAAAYRIFGRRICLLSIYPVVCYFFLTGREQRRASLSYLRRARESGILDHDPGWTTSLNHFQTFGRAVLDKFAAWTGQISRSDIEDASAGLLSATEAGTRGVFVITAHLGNAEVLRALANMRTGFPVNVLVHTTHAQRFNRLIEKISPKSRVRAIQVSRLGPESIIMLGEAIERGEWVVMAGDRIAVRETGERVVHVPFLGEPAPFPQGPVIFASLLRCPVYLMFCLRVGDHFRVYFEKLTDQIILPRRHKAEAIRVHVGAFVKALERHLAVDPLQWFNFYEFWRPSGL